jgi:hypothetical protein
MHLTKHGGSENMGCEPNLIEFLAPYVSVLWKDWPMDMTARTVGGNQFTLSGICPHCDKPTVFTLVTPQVHFEQPDPRNSRIYVWGVLQCQGCGKYICGAVHKPQQNSSDSTYSEHYPLGKPKDDVADEIPKTIAADFKEALRCRWVDAYNATVEMCRRAVQASCIDKKGPYDEKLVKQIDWLAAQGIITTPLKDMAHRVRLGGNLGAHPPEDPEDETTIIIGAEYADAVIEFTRDFFQHVYVMPECLKKFTFSRKADG